MNITLERQNLKHDYVSQKSWEKDYNEKKELLLRNYKIYDEDYQQIIGDGFNHEFGFERFPNEELGEFKIKINLFHAYFFEEFKAGIWSDEINEIINYLLKKKDLFDFEFNFQIISEQMDNCIIILVDYSGRIM